MRCRECGMPHCAYHEHRQHHHPCSYNGRVTLSQCLLPSEHTSNRIGLGGGQGLGRSKSRLLWPDHVHTFMDARYYTGLSRAERQRRRMWAHTVCWATIIVVLLVLLVYGNSL